MRRWVAVQDRRTVEQRLPLQRRQVHGLAEGVHEEVVRDIRLEDEQSRPVLSLADGLEDLPPRRRERRRVAHRVDERLHGSEAVGLAAVLLDQTEPLKAAKNQVEAPVRKRLATFHPAGAAARVDGGPSLVVRLPAGAQQDHADRLVRVDDVAHHLPIPLLEDMEGQGHLRKQNRVGQREERKRGRKGLRRHRGRAVEARGGRQARRRSNQLKDCPQPQVELALGFLIAKPPPIRSSL